MAISQQQRTDLLTLVVGLFDAAPSSDLVQGLSTGLESGATLDLYAANLGGSSEFQSIYPTNQSVADFATSFITNLVGDNASADAKSDGEDFIAALLANGVSKSQAAYEAVKALSGASEDDAVWGVAAAELHNKVEVANSFADANFATLTLEQMQSVLAGVTSDDATVAAKQAAIADGSIIEGDDGDNGDNGDGGDVVFSEVFAWLTTSTDRGAEFTGTDADELFNAYTEQLGNAGGGGVANSLSSADILDGGAGTDKLVARLLPEFFGQDADTANRLDVQPETDNIEIVTIEAVDATSTITLDAKRMADVDRIGSFESDGDLIIDNLTTKQSATSVLRNTEALTITMDHTAGAVNDASQNEASDLTVYFDEDYLISGQSTGTSQANYWLLDEESDDYVNEPLLNIERTGVSFTIDGVSYRVEMEDSVAKAADTWAQFAQGLQDVIDASGEAAFDGLTVAVDASNTDSTFNDDGVLVTIPAITITDEKGRDIVPTGFLTPEDATGNFDIYGSFNNVESQETKNPVTINVELDKVGRDADGGNLVIGAKDQTTTSASNDTDGDTDKDQTDGIEVFNIDVLGDNDRPSNLGLISSTNQALRTVNVTNGQGWDGADLTVREELGQGQELTLIDATGFEGDFSLALNDFATGTDSVVGQQAITSNFGSGNDSYQWTSSQADTVSSDKDYSISMGAGNDTVIVNLDGDSVDALGESFSLKTGAGSDTVTFNEANGVGDDGVSQETMNVLENISVDLGSEDDTLTMDNEFRASIDAGTGNDLVYMKAAGTTGTATVGDTTGAQTFAERVLYNADLTVTFAGFEATVDVNTVKADGYVADQSIINTAIMNAIENDAVLSKLLTVKLIDGAQALQITSNYEGANDLDIAIYQPQIVESAATTGQVVLNSGDLAALEKGFIETTALDSDDFTSTNVAVTAIEGLNNFWGNVQNNGTGTEAAVYSADGIGRDVETARGATAEDIFDAEATYLETVIGTDSATGINRSSIEMGQGTNDIVIMHSNDANLGELKFTGAFGKVSVQNWHDTTTKAVTDAADMGLNALDFTTFLTNQTDPSTTNGTTSAQDVAVTTNIVNGAEAVTGLSAGVTNTNTAEANSVNVIRFIEDAANSETFENLTATGLVAALNNGGTAYGNLDDNLLDAAVYATTDANYVIGGTGQYIIMVEDSTNEGTYKVFSVEADHNSADNANGDFTASTAVELGTIDFGASINVLTVGSAQYDAAVSVVEEIAELFEQAGVDYAVDKIEFTGANATVTLAAGTSNTVAAQIQALSNVSSVEVAAVDYASTTALNAAFAAETALEDGTYSVTTEAGTEFVTVSTVVEAGDPETRTVTVDFNDDSATLTKAELAALVSTDDMDVDTVTLTDADVITLQVADLDALPVDSLSANDVIDFTEAVAVSQTAFEATFITAELNTTEADEITVTGVTGAKFAAIVAELDANDTVVVADGQTVAFADAAAYNAVVETVEGDNADATVAVAADDNLTGDVDLVTTFDVSSLEATEVASIANFDMGDSIDTGAATIAKGDFTDDGALEFVVANDGTDTTVSYELAVDDGAAQVVITLPGVALTNADVSVDTGVITYDIA